MEIQQGLYIIRLADLVPKTSHGMEIRISSSRTITGGEDNPYEHQKSEPNIFIMENLLSKIYKIASQRKGFSFLTMVGQTTREMTHSAFIAELLNPCGCHGEGSLFLDIFIEELSKIKTVIFNSNTAKVCIEKDFGPERENEDGHFGGGE